SYLPHALVIVVGIEKPAEAVGSGSPVRMVGLTLWRIDRGQSGLHLGFTEQRVVAQSPVPLLQILERGINSTIAEHGRSGALIGFPPAIALPRMTIGTMGDFVLPLFIRDSVLHIERSEDTLLQKLAERLARNFLH